MGGTVTLRKALMVLAGASTVAMLWTGAAYAQKKVLAVVVKGLDNPFFTAMGQGCADWNVAHPDSEYECVYAGPALSSDEAGEVQIVKDLITSGAAGIAISPSNAPAMANMLRAAAPSMPIITVDADLLPEDKDLRKTYFGTNNYDMGVHMATELKKLKPEGGTVCLQLGSVAAANINERAAGFRDTISGEKGLERLTGQGGWIEIDRCPTYTNDDIPTANQQMADVLTANPDLDAFILVGGWAQLGPRAYAQNTDQVKAKLDAKELIIIAGDMRPPQTKAFREGRSHFQIGQRPYQMGNEAPDILITLIEGGTVEDPKFTGLDLCTLEDPGICAQ
jgi:ribose transport system substrate-binding protein